MGVLAKLESDEKYRTKLCIPLLERAYKFLDHSSVLPLAQDLQVSLQNWRHSDEFDSLLRSSLSIIDDFSKSYIKRFRPLFGVSKEMHLESLQKINENCHESYQAFDSLMDFFKWSPELRNEVRKNAEHRVTPFGTPADLACQYILDLCQETCQCSEIHQEKQLIEEHIHTLHSIFSCCCCYIVLLRWLATLLCLSTSLSNIGNPLDLSKHKDLLLTIVEQKRDDIIHLYHFISQIAGHDFMQKVAPLLETVGISPPTEENQSPELPAMNGFVPAFYAILIKLLAVASLRPESIGKYDAYADLIESRHFLESHTSCFSHVILLTATAMKRQVEAFREKALAEDRLCKHLIATLTSDDH